MTKVFNTLRSEVDTICVTWTAEHIDFQATNSSLVTVIRLRLFNGEAYTDFQPETEQHTTYVTLATWVALLQCMSTKEVHLVIGDDRLGMHDHVTDASIPLIEIDADMVTIPDNIEDTLNFIVNTKNITTTLKKLKALSGANDLRCSFWNDRVDFIVDGTCGGASGTMKCAATCDAAPQSCLLLAPICCSLQLLLWLFSCVHSTTCTIQVKDNIPIGIITKTPQFRFDGYLAPKIAD